MGLNQKSSTAIKHWSEEDRPREKLIKKGRKALTNSELVAILLGSGTLGFSALQLARNLLDSANNDLDTLAGLDFGDFMKIKGIGIAKAIIIAAALELGRRRRSVKRKSTEKILSSQDVYDYCFPLMVDEQRELFISLYLRTNNTVIKNVTISSGGVAGTFVDPKIVFREALSCLAYGIVLVHNHPSGSVQPSRADLQLTQKITQAGQFLDIKILDHIIFGENSYFSFADQGLL